MQPLTFEKPHEESINRGELESIWIINLDWNISNFLDPEALRVLSPPSFLLASVEMIPPYLILLSSFSGVDPTLPRHVFFLFW